VILEHILYTGNQAFSASEGNLMIITPSSGLIRPWRWWLCVPLGSSIDFSKDYNMLYPRRQYCHVSGVCVTNNTGFWIGWLDLLALLLQLQPIIIVRYQWVPKTRSILTGLRASSLLRDWLGSDLRIGHFFSFRCPLVDTPQLNTQLLNYHLNSLTNESLMNSRIRVRVRVRVTLRLAVYRQSVRLGAKPLETHDQRFFFQLNPCGHTPYVTSSLTTGWVCCLQFLLGLASAVILRSEFRWTHDHILLSQIRDSPNLEGQVPVFISPRNRVAQLYLQPLGSLCATRRAVVEVFVPASTRVSTETL
jgi:hypothetical protein